MYLIKKTHWHLGIMNLWASDRENNMVFLEPPPCNGGNVKRKELYLFNLL